MTFQTDSPTSQQFHHPLEHDPLYLKKMKDQYPHLWLLRNRVKDYQWFPHSSYTYKINPPL